MAKLQLEPYLFTAVQGVSGSASFKTTELRKSQVKFSPGKKHRDLHRGKIPARGLVMQKPQVSRFWPEFPRVQNAPCEAWKICDRHYSIHKKRFAETWRRLVTKKRISAYTSWMKQAVPHVLRGLTKSQVALRPVGWSLREFEQTPYLFTLPGYVPSWAESNEFCQTQGLYHLRFNSKSAWYYGPPGPGDPPPEPFIWYRMGWEVRWHAESYHHNCDHPRKGWISIDTYDVNVKKIEDGSCVHSATNQLYPPPFFIKTQPRLYYSKFYPPKYDLNAIWDEDGPDVPKGVEVFWLRPGATFRYWPQIIGKKKGWKLYYYDSYAGEKPSPEHWGFTEFYPPWDFFYKHDEWQP